MSIAQILKLAIPSRSSQQREIDKWMQRCIDNPRAMGTYIQSLLSQQREQNTLINWQNQLIEKLKIEAGYADED
jgi:hypothetical protein